MSKPIISVENLSKKYIIGENIHGRGARTFRDMFDQKLRSLFRRGEDRRRDNTILWALKDISFDVRQGEVVGIIGGNGAGKSTLLKVLSRITEPTGGQVTVRGRVASLLEVGTGFNQELTGRENIFLNGSILGMKRSEIREKFDEIVAFADVEKFIDTPVKRYSSGMYVRLAFAVAAHMDTEILLVDEVLAVGDVGFQKKSLSKMEEVTGCGRTVMFVSHNMNLVRSMCTRAILIREGILLCEGETSTVIDSYLSQERNGPLCRTISESDHSLGVGKVRVRMICLTDSSGNVLEEILYHQPIHVRIDLEVVSHVSAGTFSLSILTNEGVRLLMTHSLDSDDQYIELLPGKLVVEATLENYLRPGDYVIEFGGHQLPTTMSLCNIPDAIKFHISDRGHTIHDRFNFHNRSGMVDARCKWRIAHD